MSDTSNWFHQPGCGCAQHTFGGGLPPAGSDGCPRRRPATPPIQVMLHFGQPSLAAGAFLAATGTRSRSLSPAADAFVHSARGTTPALAAGTRQPVGVSTTVSSNAGAAPGVPERTPANIDAEVEELINLVAAQVAAHTPSGLPTQIIDSAVIEVLERVEARIERIEERISGLADRGQVNALRADIDRLVTDIPNVATIAVNQILQDMHLAGVDMVALTSEVQAKVGQNVLDQLPAVVEVLLRDRAPA